MTLKKFKHFLLGKPRDLFDKNLRSQISLAAFLAWIGLGADGLSSACYGPEEAFLALADHGELAIYLAIATAIIVFIISAAYMQVIELFPNGGGGYRVATTLVSPGAGLVAGSALVVDYVLTIAISVASGVDAMFSLVSPDYGGFKVPIEVLLIVVLTVINLRGMKESIRFLLPIFLGFVITHAAVIIYGIIAHHQGISTLIPKAIDDSRELSEAMGWGFTLALFLKALSLGGGTYTGLEAVSNNVHALEEPKVKTGKLTMIFVAASLAFMAAGIILLYLLWDAEKIPGQTLNAAIFYKVLLRWHIGDVALQPIVLPMLMFFEAGLLLVAANTGFLAGPAVLANLANDRWMPEFLSALSSRLVVKNGIILMGISAIVALLITQGHVHVLVVLYSINVFLTFSLSLTGLCRHWLSQKNRRWGKLLVAGTGLLVCVTILVITVTQKFATGGWITLVITSCLIFLGARIRQTYRRVEKAIRHAEEEQYEVAEKPKGKVKEKPIDMDKPTAAIVVNEHFGSGIHTLRMVQKLFPDVYDNFIFIVVGEVDTGNFTEEEDWQDLRRDTRRNLRRFENHCRAHGMPAESYLAYGTDAVERQTELCRRVARDFPNVVFFGVKLVMLKEGILTQLLFNQTAYLLQRRINAMGHTMVILPMKV